MIISIIFLLVYFALYLVIFLYPKTETRLNLLKQLVLTAVTEWILFVVPSLLFKVVGITLTLEWMSFIALLLILPLLWAMWKTGKIQKYYINKYDVINVGVITIAFGILFFHVFTPDLELCYMNSDAANHFDMAMRIVRNKQYQVGSMYFPALINATVINIAKPFLEELYYYKAFIISDALVKYLECLLFYVVLSQYSRGKKIKKFLVVPVILYFAGYPIYSYLIGGFVYWGMGVFFVLYLIYLLDIYFKEDASKKKIEILIMLTFLAISLCYFLFVPIAFAASFCCFIFSKGSRNDYQQKILTISKLFLLPVFVVLVFVIYKWQGGFGNLLSNVQEDGGIYSNLYSDFIFLVPFVIYNIINCLKTKIINNVHYFTFISICVTFVMLLACYKGYISRYYYYKMYYILWAVIWIEAVIAIDRILEEQRDFLISYLSVICVLFVFQMTDIEDKVIDRVPNIQLEEARSNLFPIYQYNYFYIGTVLSPWDDEARMELYQYVWDNYPTCDESGKMVPLVVSKDRQGDCAWYSAITSHYSQDFYVGRYTEEIVLNNFQLLDQYTDHFLVLKESDVYREYESMFNQYEIVFENPVGIIYDTKK